MVEISSFPQYRHWPDRVSTGSLRGIVLAGLAVAALMLSGIAGWAQQDVIQGERYIPTIWVDPDGCEHWVMDDGWEGYMSPHVDRQGLPVCNRAPTCGTLNSDQLFASNQSTISADGRRRLVEFFRSSTATSFAIAGHTDSRASDEYNMALSLRRANAVAAVAKSVGARITDVRGYGERDPIDTNATAAGRARNRRVEIICFR
ncbi:MAG: cell envelope biogenesis protein OmpA [Confluentimicrobium sp.]|jgi:outer membrane protein OmpA-like peptidoglycan-associated protein|nr:cell envelope biogenesis protein OmpA [Actibacterium sp.]|tara:strand:- start:5731 stop:6339 length:609 start_codon:yes stop_codon:yes gene_type:complete